ncbi:hypothetical protein D9758_000790 [Tetrapyrgos nigripes]|uniref:N-acetyltransferase domain-containing protein n=1 Tax=Tetrapyrgos nigripes TaxID=182062 RepID=A0A8H5GZB5_9AGAR|nr:hypothetical protein D9758_000790 [Tetrapyrgos nigripes]
MFEISERLTIRPFKETDLDHFLDLSNDVRVQPTLTTDYVVPHGPKHKDELKKILETAIFCGIIETREAKSQSQSEPQSESDSTSPKKPDKEWVGITSIHSTVRKNRDGMWGIVLDPKHWNRGYGTEVTTWMVDYAFQWLNMNRVSLSVYEGNPRAIDLYKRVGFIEEGRKRKCNWVNGRWEDIISMGILEDEWRASKQA